MSDSRALECIDAMEDLIADYQVVDSLGDYLPEVGYPRVCGSLPREDDNPYNAWYVKTDIQGATGGLLKGRTVAMKDNICVAGIPMMNGASTLEGYVPEFDATVVTRVLDAGGVIAGKAHCEYLCVSGSSYTNAKGSVHNPHRRGYSAGGSSSGCGALVAGGVVDMAIGGDQGGSIRIPAAYSGCYGMKPTYGLVPYSGVIPVDNSIDHVGPMTQNVVDNARLLQAIAGEDGMDPRQHIVAVGDYVNAVHAGVSGMKIGVLQEGFGSSMAQPDVESAVMQCIEVFGGMDVSVEEVSIPMHRHAPALWTPIALEGLTKQMMKGRFMGTGWKGFYMNSLQNHHANWQQEADLLDDTVIVSMLLGEFYDKQANGTYYGRAQNLARKLREEYDRVLDGYDLLVMPTVPITATALVASDEPLSEYMRRTGDMGANVCAANLTGHPAMSIPCGMCDGLPVGLMLVAGRWRESEIYSAAAVIEQNYDWTSNRAL